MRTRQTGHAFLLSVLHKLPYALLAYLASNKHEHITKREEESMDDTSSYNVFRLLNWRERKGKKLNIQHDSNPQPLDFEARSQLSGFNQKVWLKPSLLDFKEPRQMIYLKVTSWRPPSNRIDDVSEAFVTFLRQSNCLKSKTKKQYRLEVSSRKEGRKDQIIEILGKTITLMQLQQQLLSEAVPSYLPERLKACFLSDWSSFNDFFSWLLFVVWLDPRNVAV